MKASTLFKIAIAALFAIGSSLRAQQAQPAEKVYELPKFTVSPFEGQIDIFIGYEFKQTGTKIEYDSDGKAHRRPVLIEVVKYVRVDRVEPGSVREARIGDKAFIVSIGEGPNKLVLPGMPRWGKSKAGIPYDNFKDYLIAISRVPAGQDFVLETLPPRGYGQTMEQALSGKPTTVRVPTKKVPAAATVAVANN